MSAELTEEQERLRQWLVEEGERQGYATVEVAADRHGAGYVFSVGAWRNLGVPEGVVIGLPDGMGRMLLDAYLNRARTGERFVLGRPYLDFFDNTPVVFERVMRGHYPEFLGSALLVYPRGEFPAIQLIVATPRGAWPWQPDAPDGFADWQPVLTQSGEPESWIPGVDGP